MTACTNHGGKARRVVTAALVGVLSVGTVPMVALATGANDGIETLAADWSTNAKVSAAEDGKGAVYTGDLSKPVSFAQGSGKYLVPTEVTGQAGTTSIDPNEYVLTYTVAVDNDDDLEGINADWKYYYADGTLAFEAPTSGDIVLSAKQAEAYFSGELRGSKPGEVVTVKDASYKVTVTGKDGKTVDANFSIVASDPYAGAYAYVGTGKDVVFSYAPLMDGDIQFAKADGTPIVFGTDYDGIVWYNADGTIANASANTNAGTYTAVLTKSGVEVTRINFTVEKYDVSKHAPAIADFINGVNGSWTLDFSANAGTDFLNEWLGAVAPDFQVVSVTSPDGSNGFVNAKGEYTVTVKAKDGKINVTGETTVTFSNLDKSLYTEPNMDLYYGATALPDDGTGSVAVNLTEGQTFDASKIKVREADGTPSYSGDALEVTYKQGSTFVDASALSKAGTYTVTVRVKPFMNEDGQWVGGTNTFTVNVNGNKAYGDNVVFYLDGVLAGSSTVTTYDGTDQLGRVTATVTNPEGGSFEYGTDFTFVVTKGGEEVDSIVDAGTYEIVVKPLTFQFDSSVLDTEITFTLTVNPLTISGLRDYYYNGDDLDATTADGADFSGYVNDAVAWTGSAIEVPGVQYKNAKGSYVALDKGLYNVVRIVDAATGKVVKEVTEEGLYTVTIALSDDAGTNYALGKERTFDFEVIKYSPFDDVESPAWYASVVADAKYTNLVHGMSGTNMFAPTADITRADAVCIMFNLAGGDNAMGDYEYNEVTGWVTGFSDVDGMAYYAKALAWAHNAGVVNGDAGATTFRPTDKITRQELAAMIANYAKATGKYEATDGSALAAMPDASTVSGWATEVVDWAVQNGVMGNGGYVAGQDNIIRAEVAAMAVNYTETF